MLSCTMSSAASSLRTWQTESLNARFSTLLRKSESSRSVAKTGQPGRGSVPVSSQKCGYPARGAFDYRIRRGFFRGMAVLHVLQCDNRHCNSKANGSRSGAAIIPPMSLASSSKLASQGNTSPAPGAQDLMGSEILIKSLQAENVQYIWGYPGGAVLYIYDALYKQDTIQHVLVRHEQAAVHAADGYARATGEVGVALVTSGPGLTNAVTGIATAYMDSIPMVIISGQVPTPAIGLDAFQECDTVGITRPIVKHNFLVKDPRDLAMTMKKAFHIARTGRPGPVVVDVQ